MDTTLVEDHSEAPLVASSESTLDEPDNVMCCGRSTGPALLQVIVGSTWGFLTNVERAIIMPSLWLYLKNAWNEEAAKKYYAATVAAFCLSVFLFTPLVGYASQKGVRTHVLLLISNLLEVGGNILYLTGSNPWVLLIGRFLSGIGACCDVPLYSDMVRLTTQQARTSYVIALLLPRQAGLLFGPAFTILVDKLNVKVGNFNINVYNVPGLVMASLWVLHCILTIAIYPSVDRVLNPPPPPGEVRPTRFCARLKERIVAPVVTSEIGSAQHYPVDQLAETYELNTCSPCCLRHPRCYPYLMYTTCAMIAMYGIIFMTYFTSFALEAILPPVAHTLYGWTELETSIVYLASGGVVVLLFFTYQCVKRCVSDLTILCTGMGLLLLSYTWLACYLAYRPRLPIPTGIAMLMCGVFLHVLGTPMVSTTCESMYTKLVPVSDVQRGQIIFRMVLNVGFFVGPYVAGSLVGVPYLAFLLMMLLVFFPTVLLWLDYASFARCK